MIQIKSDHKPSFKQSQVVTNIINSLTTESSTSFNDEKSLIQSKTNLKDNVDPSIPSSQQFSGADIPLPLFFSSELNDKTSSKMYTSSDVNTNVSILLDKNKKSTFN